MIRSDSSENQEGNECLDMSFFDEMGAEGKEQTQWK